MTKDEYLKQFEAKRAQVQRLLAAGKLTQRQIAAKVGVSQQRVSQLAQAAK